LQKAVDIEFKKAKSDSGPNLKIKEEPTVLE